MLKDLHSVPNTKKWKYPKSQLLWGDVRVKQCSHEVNRSWMLCGMTGTEQQDSSAQASRTPRSPRAFSEPLGAKYTILWKSH